MQYTNPLYLLADKNLSELNAANLKKWRKETLLRFDLGGATTLEIAGKEYDKNQLKAAFDQMKEELDFHKQVFQNKPLLHFLETGDLAIFKTKGNFQDLNDQSFRQKIKPYFVFQLSETIYKCATQTGFHSIHTLKDFMLSDLKLPDDFIDETYAKTFAYLDHFVKEGEEKLQDPYQKSNRKKLKKEAIDLFNLHTLNVLQNLPDYFSGVARRYAILAHNYLVKVLRNNPYPDQTSRPVARVLLNACKIDAGLRNDPQSKALAKTFEKILDQKPISVKRFTGHTINSPWKIGLLIIGLIIFFARLGNLAGGCHLKSDYEKSVDRYNYHRKKEREKKIRVNLPKSDLLGSWRSDMFLDKTRIFRTIHFYTENFGKTTYQFVSTTGEEHCRLTAWFNWNLKPNQRDFSEHFIYTQHLTPIEIGGHVNLLPENEQKVFEGIQQRMEYELFEELLIMEPGDDEFKVAGKKYDQEEKFNTLVDLPESVQTKIAEMIQQERVIEEIGRQFAAQFELSADQRGKFILSAIPMNKMLVVNHNYGVDEAAAKIEIYQEEPFLKPLKWTKGKGYQLKGVFRNVNYIKKNEQKTGDLELMYHYSRSFRFREKNEEE